MTESADLLAIAVRRLRASTVVGQRVYTPLDWPTWDEQYPYLKVRITDEDSRSMGKGGAPAFTTVATLAVSGKVQAPGNPDDTGATDAETAAWALVRQVRKILVNDYELFLVIQECTFIRTRVQFSAEGAQHLAEFVVELGLEFYEGAENFHIPEVDVFQELSLTADLGNVYDPNGTYPAPGGPQPPFPAAIEPAPRAAGPDGRAEGGLHIVFPSS